MCMLIVLIVFAKTGSGQNNAKEKSWRRRRKTERGGALEV
eukprot:COSAG06_NODE_2711_length_6401_cov_343.215192_8_plen_40_part_00